MSTAVRDTLPANWFRRPTAYLAQLMWDADLSDDDIDLIGDELAMRADEQRRQEAR